jgi:hypothetical protein
VLVAFTILAIFLTALIQAFSQGLRATDLAEERATAVLVARSTLAEVGRSLPLEDGEQSGSLESGLEWRLTIDAPQSDELSLGEDSPLRTYQVTVLIQRGDRPLFRLRTLRIGPVP